METQLAFKNRGYTHVAVEYRLVYLRPNKYSDEALMIGVIGDSEDGNHFASFVTSIYAQDILRTLYGAGFIEEFNFGIEVFRKKYRDLAAHSQDFDSPTDMFDIGRPMRAYCDNLTSFIRSTLDAMSSLSKPNAFADDATTQLSQELVCKSLFDAVMKIDAGLGAKLFEGIAVPLKNRSIEAPIFGERILGAPVSFAVNRFEPALKIAEAFISKFTFIKQHHARHSAIYILEPDLDSAKKASQLDAGLEELTAVAKANNTKLRFAKSIDELASHVLHDEAKAA